MSTGSNLETVDLLRRIKMFRKNKSNENSRKMQLKSRIRKLKKECRKKDSTISLLSRNIELIEKENQKRKENHLILREKILLKMQTISEDDKNLSEMFGIKQKHKHELMGLINSEFNEKKISKTIVN